MTELLWAVIGIVIGGGLVAGRRWSRLDAARFEADAYWDRYVECERQRNNLERDLAAAQVRVNTLQGERDLAAYQLTQLAAVAAEPAPLPHLYLPAVMREPRMPPPEYTPAMPIATPEPPVSGDVQ